MASTKKSLKIYNLLENTPDLSLKRKARVLLEELNLQPNDKILEIGCGDGYYFSKIAQLGDYYMVGIDNDVNGLNASEHNFKLLKIGYQRIKNWKNTAKKTVYLLEGDAQKLPFSDNYFDKVIMSEVAEHLPNDVKGLKEAYRVLKTRGTIIVTVPNWYYPLLWDPVNWILERLLGTHFKNGFWAGIWNQHIRLYKPDEIREVVRKAGFEIKRFEVQTRWCIPFNHFIANIGARMLAAKVLPQSVHQQVNKFEKADPEKRFWPIDFYYKLANFMDSFNKTNHSRVGTTIFITAQK